ncbi:Gfo/Idh/MocA family oxidoreductase [Pontibacter sp. HSC-14F20]|uniref:Gfo/Idh/MocA family oxidoreductase n=1 Tax=Pontibacter sp. HSC-14F20 TaxID=2864136 RepID=UPI001C73AFB2|nr:Gfo/Idh/MocA family oxidoreductase [Pontibacter sp. HSC-14F20]MBX0335016.1 Gfo/Idh/MocA family oxidoreductase [Pontibacter sp. HSC-14F20]
MMQQKISVGLLGFGMAGRVFHAPIVSAIGGLRLSKIKANRPESIALAKQLYPDTTVVSDTSPVLEDPEIELVIVATTNATHFELAKAALQAGKHVVVEKPFTVTSKEANELIELARAERKLLTVYQNRRWDSDFKTVTKLLENEMLGRLVEYEAHFDRFRPIPAHNTWKEENQPGTGILYDLGSHLIDQALVLFGTPREVYADLRTQRSCGQIIDSFDLSLYYANGFKAILKAGMLVRQPGPRFLLSGDQGSFVKYGLDVQEAALKAGLAPTAPNWGEEPEEIWGRLDTEVHGQRIVGKIQSEAGDYRGFYENVRDSILGIAELDVKAVQARNTIRIIELAMQSNEKKRRFPFE